MPYDLVKPSNEESFSFSRSQELIQNVYGENNTEMTFRVEQNLTYIPDYLHPLANRIF